jgi:flagellar motor switch protein FliN
MNAETTPMAEIDPAPIDGGGWDTAALGAAGANYPLLASIPVRLSVEVGRASMRLSELLDLAEGSVVTLDRRANDLLDIMANGTLLAKGEVVTVNGRYGIRIVELHNAAPAQAGLERRR